MYCKALPLLLIGYLLAACDKPIQERSANQTVAQPVAVSTNVASSWLGKWIGPEGTDLEVMSDGQKHTIAIRNLDGVRMFEASSTHAGLTFERDGAIETIRPGSGRDTGMKWLQDKSNCLAVKLGEGYCRE